VDFQDRENLKYYVEMFVIVKEVLKIFFEQENRIIYYIKGLQVRA